MSAALAQLGLDELPVDRGAVGASDVRVAVGTHGADGGRSGIGRYLVHLLREWGRLPDRSFQVELIAADRERDAFGAPWTVPCRAPDYSLNPVAGVAWYQLGIQRLCRERDADVLFLPAANRRSVLRSSVPTVGTVHDFSSLHVRGKYDPARHLYITRVLPALVRGLDHVITPSEASKRDVVEHARVEPERVTVIPNGVDHDTYHPGSKEEARRRVREALGVDGPFLLYVSRLEHPGKNHVRLIQAFDALRRTRQIPHKLVLAGSDWTRAEEIHQAASESASKDAIVLPGFVPGALLPDLNLAADVVVFPSLYEGFGIPVLEAMASGTPVVTSDRSSLPEVGGEAAVYCDPLRVDSIAGALDTVLSDPLLRSEMVRRGLERSAEYSWARTARETLSVVLRHARNGR